MIDFLLINSNNVLAFLTGILVLITGYYAWQTRMMVKNTHLPSLKIYKTNIFIGDDLTIGLKNIGTGSAKDVIGSITFKSKNSEDKSFNFKYTLLIPNEKIVIQHHFDDINRNNVGENYNKIILDCTFIDILNNKKKVKDVIDLSQEDIINMNFDSDNLSEINYNLRNIERAIENLKR